MQAEILLEWLDQRGVDRIVLVGHEQGGAVSQQIVANHSDRVIYLVLIDSVTHDNWPIPLAARVMRLARTPGLDTGGLRPRMPSRAANLHRDRRR